jgi:hypothetical protein
VIAATAKALDCSAAQLQAAILADLPGEKLIPRLPPQLHPAELALRVNLALVQALLRRATQLRVAVWGNARDIVRYAHLRGLLCVVRAGDTVADSPAAWLEISGPMSLFRRTRLYGNALAALVPRMGWCDRFEVHAECMFGDEIRSVRIGSGDPIFPAEQPKPFDSGLEQRFARDFARAAPDWDVVREPMPLAVGGHLFFPDFALVHRRDPARRTLLEIIGFWTPTYLANKLALVRSAGRDDLIICLDEARNCGEHELPAGVRVVRYRRRIDPQEVLKLLDTRNAA